MLRGSQKPRLPTKVHSRPELKRQQKWSTSDRSSTGIRDTHTLDLGRPAVQAERLSHHHCEPVEHKRCQRLAREPMTEFKHVLDSAALTAGKQLKRLTPFRA